MICSYCNTDPGLKSTNQKLWNGFLDQDTGEHVCWSCRTAHYQKKSKTSFKNLYSEVPVPI